MDDCSYASLKDFDWSLRLVLSSNKISGIRQPLMQLKLDTTGPNGEVKETLVEMNRTELEAFISTLKDVKKAISNK
jgi:hypothetical protein